MCVLFFHTSCWCCCYSCYRWTFVLLMPFLFLWKKSSISIVTLRTKLFCFYLEISERFCIFFSSLTIHQMNVNVPSKRESKKNSTEYTNRFSNRFYLCTDTCDVFFLLFLNSNTHQFRLFCERACGICTIFANKHNDNSV